MSVLSNANHLHRRALSVASNGEFRRGFALMLPLWPGVIAFAVAFAIAARAAGFSAPEVVALSLFIFAGSAQVATVALYASGAGFIPIVLTGLLLNFRHTFYGLSVSRWLPERTTPPKPILAFFLTDESYGMTIRSLMTGHGGSLYLFGASTSLWVIYIASTASGAVLGGRLPFADSTGLEFIFPLTFIALLVPLLRGRVDVAVALIAAVLMYLLDGRVPDGASIVLVILIAAAAGVLLDSRGREAAA